MSYSVFFKYLIILICAHICLCRKYHNYTLYRGIPVNEKHLRFLKNLSSYYDVDFWRQPGLLDRPVEFMINPRDKDNFLRAADDMGLYLTTIFRDVQREFDKQTMKNYIHRRTESFDWRNYFRLSDIYEWLHDMTVANPHEMQMIKIGTSHEGRDILAVRVALKSSKLRSKVIVEGGIHAREWISPAFVTYMLHQILYSEDSMNEELKTVARTYEWFFIPVVNPDGYVYSQEEDRMWRKNRHDFGVDLNRNFGIAFGTVGISRSQGDEIYCGAKAFSEKESAALANFVSSNNQNLEYYLAFHSYGQYMIIPYAHSTKHWDNYDEMKSILSKVAKRISRRSGTKYSVGTAFDTVGYITSGVSGCWVKKMYQIPYVATFELRDDGRYGFALPPEQILPTCKETMDGMLTLLSPKTASFSKLRESALSKSGNMVLDKIVVVSNVIAIIIMFH